MDRPLVVHAHRQCHVLLKARGSNTFFHVRDGLYPLTERTAVLVNAWEPHCYAHHDPLAPRTVILALYIEPEWLSLIHISEPTRQAEISYAVFCLKKKKK